ncbi:non-homologous end-joining DNA ligase [Streptacidiphilus monticola]|jgi:bifunctional non-homologous end joining protein LigD|uniref:DNA ligase (ATP) n=1 Tax=Streptacidiphilus monticola TaxID=2161674 RepID=A0ABW1G6V0_9ACTN
MLATLSSRRDFDTDWLFERKLDGVRVLALRTGGGGVRLLSRGGKSLNGTYPEVVDALQAQHCADFAVDGEMVALRDGRTDFALLQQRLGLTDPKAARASGVAVTYYLFDLLRLDGQDTTALDLTVRKSLLRDALSFRDPLRFTAHRRRDGHELLDDACARGWEGLIAKRANSRYQYGRSTDWLKLKCSGGQEFVIGGFTEPAGSRVGFGALLIGYYQHGRLCYAGKVGTGYSTATLRSLRTRLDGIEQSGSPFDARVREARAHWVRPELVAQIGFTEWTRDGMLRHPRFLGLRDDKPAHQVVREAPAPTR